MSRQEFANALRSARAQRNLTQQEAASLLGIPHRTYVHYESATSAPSQERRTAILDALSADAPAADGVLAIPGGSEAGAGPARNNDHHGLEVVRIERSEVVRVTGLEGPSLNGLRWFTVVGDSMAPDLRPGERVFFTPCHTFAADGYYIAEMDGERLVKRIQRHGGGVLDLVPVNPDYQTERLIPMREADAPNTYRSQLSGAVVTLNPVGKVAFNFTAR